MTSKELADIVASLVGRRLVGIHYVELPYQDQNGAPVSGWNNQTDYDELDHGLGLCFADSVVWVGWDWDFYNYNLAVRRTPLWREDQVRDWDVTDNSRWTMLLGRAITGVQLWWDWQRIGDGNPIWGPQDLELEFEGGAKVYVSALELSPDHQPWGHMDNLTVFFGEEVARRFPVGPFATDPVPVPPDD